MTTRRRGQTFELFPLLCVYVACLALTLGGCSEDDNSPLTPQPSPSPSPSPSPNPGPNLSFPQTVLSALEMAYSGRDSVTYMQLFDSTYTGTSVDMNDPGTSIFVNFGEEARHIAALASTPGLIATLDLGHQFTWDRLMSDDPSHPEWAIIQISGSAYQIMITDGSFTLGAVGEPGTFQEFAFSPTPDSTSPTDTLWRIVRWRETGNSEPDFP